jgi:hypothetical protein
MPNLRLNFLPFTSEQFLDTPINAISHVMGNCSATKSAAAALNHSPSILIAYLDHLKKNDALYSPKDRITEIRMGIYRVIAYKKADTNSVWYIRDLGVSFFTPEDKIRYKVDEKIHCVPVPNAKKLIDISAQIDKGHFLIDLFDGGCRGDEPNAPVYASSDVFKTARVLRNIAAKYGLKDRDALDAGCGTGTKVFVGDGMLRSFCGVECHDPLLKIAMQNEKALEEKKVISTRPATRFIKGDFLSPDFDISKFSFVCAYRPILRNTWKIPQKLRELRKGSLVQAEGIHEMLDDPNFRQVEPEKDSILLLERI